ncbi:MAG TPA: oligosaccharide flippase family protein [bacterium]|nr:oligosaccharide flippase family protein [bacterium]
MSFLPDTIRERLDKLLSTPTRKRLASGAIWGSVAAAGSRLLTLAASFFLARILGQVGFGEYGMVNSTAGMISSLAGMGIGLTVTKHVAEFKNKDPDKVGRILALSSMVTMFSAFIYGVAFVVLAPWLATATIAAPHLAPMLQISAITVALGVINGVQTSSLDGCEAFRAKSYISVGTGIVQTVLVVIGAWLWGLKGAIAAMALGMVLTVILTRWAVTKEWRRFNIRLRWYEARQEWRVLVNFSLPSFLAAISVGPALWGSSAFLANQPNGYAELGIYNAANQWYSAVLLIPALVGTAILPVLSEKYGAGDRPGVMRVMKGMMGVAALIVVPLSIFLCLLSPLIMAGYGDGFRNTHWTFIITVATAGLLAVMQPVGNLIAASGKMWMGFIMNTGWGAFLLLGSWLMVRWGAEGLAGARLIAYLAHSVWVFGYAVSMSRTKQHENE